MKPTAEQQAVLDTRARRVRLIALAGTGKSTTLEWLARARPRERALYLVFNRSAAAAIKQRLAPRVDARTIHSLAFQSCGRAYRHKLGTPRIAEIVAALDIGHIDRAFRTRHAHHAAETLRAWFYSADGALMGAHLPQALSAKGRAPLDRAMDAERILADAHRLWRLMRASTSPLPMPHDGYLKLWSLATPVLDYDSILLDEAQDTNPAVLHVLAHQPGRVVFTGDPFQAIYGWRGAIDAMAAPADQTLYLTGSFRFGAAIAEPANRLLQWLDSQAPKLRGLGGPSRLAQPSGRAPITAIGRSNGGLFELAAKVVEKCPGEPIAFAGGIEGYDFETIEDIHRLWARLRPRQPWIASFETFAALEDYAETTDDIALKTRLRIVERYGRAVPTVIAGLRTAACEESQARFCFSTAHKAKGCEWNQVVLADDFLETTDKGKVVSFAHLRQRHPDPRRLAEEVHLLYVACTRAKRVLRLNDDLKLFSSARARHD